MAADGQTADLILTNKYGLHVRPSSNFVNLANRFRAQVFVSVNGSEEVDGKSALELTAFGAKKGATFRIRTVGEEAKKALRALSELVERGFTDPSEE